MTTSTSSGLSPEAKEFVPLIQIPPPTTIPLYIGENTIASVYSAEQQQPLIYPLIKIPEIEFHIHSPQSSSINGNTSQIVLLPTTGCYPGRQISTFYPIDYSEQSVINYSLQQPKSNGISSFSLQRGINHSSYKNSHHEQKGSTSFNNNHRNFSSTNSKRTSKGSHSHSILQKNANFNGNNNNNENLFKFRAEDFPTLPQTDKIQTQSLTSPDTKSWNTVVSTPRPESISPSPNQQRSDRSPSLTKKPVSLPEQQRSQSLTSNDQDGTIQIKQKQKQKRSKRQKNKIKEEPTISIPDSIPLSLTDKNAFPTLGQEISISDKIQTQSLTAKDTKSWNTVVSTSRPQSVSPSRNQQRPVRSPSNDEPTNDQDSSIQIKPKRSKRQRNKINDEPTISIPESIPFSLDDENAFPALGQEISTSLTKKVDNNSSTKDNGGLINKSKIKTNHTYQIRLTDMFNALSTSTQTKQQNSQNKTNKSSIKSINSANPLDSKPAPKRGKEREQPKPRKPTKLKRIINKELEEHQKQRQQLFSKIPTIKQTDETNPQSETETTNDCVNILHESTTSASCSEESNNETDDDDDDDEVLDHEPTSQLQTPYSHQMPQSNIKQQIHDAGFREYCSQLIDRQLDELCIQLLLTLKRFQDRKKQQFQSNPDRARGKRRFVHGIREVTKHLRLQRLKCVLIAPDCQSIESQGGLNDALEQIINLCKEQNIPYIFTLNRQKLGRCLNKISRISTIGIFDYSGVDQIYKQIVEITNENQNAYKQILDNILNHDEISTTPSHGLNSKEFYKILHRTFQQQQRHQIVNTIPNESLSKILPKVPAHYAHSRQTSDTSTIYIDPQLINSIKKQHTRASSGTFDIGVKKNHQRTLSDGATAIDDTSIQMKHHLKTHSRTPSGCSAISQIEQQDYFEQSKNILMINNNDEISMDNDENRLKSINEDTEESSANIKRKNVEKWINDN